MGNGSLSHSSCLTPVSVGNQLGNLCTAVSDLFSGLRGGGNLDMGGQKVTTGQNCVCLFTNI